MLFDVFDIIRLSKIAPDLANNITLIAITGRRVKQTDNAMKSLKLKSSSK